MLNTGGIRGKQKSEAGKGRLAEELLLLERDRDWPRGLLCALVFVGLMVEAKRSGSAEGPSTQGSGSCFALSLCQGERDRARCKAKGEEGVSEGYV